MFYINWIKNKIKSALIKLVNGIVSYSKWVLNDGCAYHPIAGFLILVSLLIYCVVFVLVSIIVESPTYPGTIYNYLKKWFIGFADKNS